MASSSANSESLAGSIRSPPINWSYVSGIFDGEGSFNLDLRPGSGVIVIVAQISQKNRNLLERLAEFLAASGIKSRVTRNARQISELKVGRISQLRKLILRMNLVLKHEQALAVLAYYDGKITGNQLLEVFDREYKEGRRRSTPLRKGLTFPLSYVEAIRRAQEVRVTAARMSHKTDRSRRLQMRANSLPTEFDVRDMAERFKCSPTNARYLIRAMEASGLVSCNLTSMGKGHLKLVCTNTPKEKSADESLG